jgi:hypothetical protein
MIVFCEECGEKHVISEERLSSAEPIRCKVCDEVLRIYDPPSPQQGALSRTRLEIRFRDNVLEINHARPTVTMGRQLHNDVAVRDNCVSRSHARVEFRTDRFILIDQSTNGTYVQVEGKQPFNLKREEYTLMGNGIIGLGRQVKADSPEAIHFSIKV